MLELINNSSSNSKSNSYVDSDSDKTEKKSILIIVETSGKNS